MAKVVFKNGHQQAMCYGCFDSTFKYERGKTTPTLGLHGFNPSIH